ncbi:MAG: DUF4147 domain-containing protein [Rhodobacter sp.]|nr:DUF4147 domain-containing protein [Rhodobacter sp.]
MTDLHSLAKSLFQAAVAAAEPGPAVRRALLAEPLPALTGGRYLLIGVGKAASAMTEEALRHLPAGSAHRAIVVTNYENARQIEGCTCLAVGHPEPDENGLAAGQRVVDLLQSAGAGDFVLCLISGGGSALLPAPLPGLSLGDLKEVNSILLANGFDIKEINLVRQQLSRLKGGGVTQLAAPARVRALLVSDVVGDDLRVIASGPTVEPIGTAQDAMRLLKDRDVWNRLPAPVQSHLSGGAHQRPAPVIAAQNTLVSSNLQSLRAIAAAAPGWNPRIVDGALQGDVAFAARQIVEGIGAAPASGAQLLIWGGETTVNLTGTGKGGRNQDLALRMALQAGAIPGDWVFLSGGTDGRDGPTDAAGGLVDPGTVARISAAGLDAAALLANNDSYAALQAAGDLLMTGATGTNVADVQIFLRR